MGNGINSNQIVIAMLLESMRQEESDLKNYLHNEWKNNCHIKYQRYFEQWFDNLTETQLMYLKTYMEGKMSPYTE